VFGQAGYLARDQPQIVGNVQTRETAQRTGGGAKGGEQCGNAAAGGRGGAEADDEGPRSGHGLGGARCSRT
jgi:hypothetical protein